MPKTNFVNGDPSQGIMGTVVTAEFLNAVNKHRHTGEDVDGAGILDYAIDTGTANNYVINLVNLTAHVPGMPIYFKAANTNTGASTIAINALAAVPIKRNGNQNLAPNDIVAGQIVVVVYDGTNYQMISRRAITYDPAAVAIQLDTIVFSTTSTTYVAVTGLSATITVGNSGKVLAFFTTGFNNSSTGTAYFRANINNGSLYIECGCNDTGGAAGNNDESFASTFLISNASGNVSVQIEAKTDANTLYLSNRHKPKLILLTW